MSPASLRDLGVVAGMKRLLTVLFAAVRAPLGKWDVFKYALDDTGRTIRLAVLLVASALPPAAITVLTYFLVHR